MDVEPQRRPWYRRWRYVLPLGLLVILLLAGLFPAVPGPSKPRLAVALDGTVAYFVKNYNGTVGLVSEYPGSRVYWLDSDNYLVSLALGRYSANNQSTSNFAAVIGQALRGYLATLPPGLAENQYYALNSTAASFGCSADYAVSWSGPGQVSYGEGSAVLKTTANGPDQSCASQNYADLLFLQAVHYHRAGDTAEADSLYGRAARDFDGTGIVDLQNNGTATHAGARVYQTYKLALYVYATYCLGVQRTATGLASAQAILLHMQENSTGGFATSYTQDFSSLGAPGASASSGANTETTALAALALELMIQPTAAC